MHEGSGWHFLIPVPAARQSVPGGEKKGDYSPLLVHLTKDSPFENQDGEPDVMPAREVLNCILDEHKLKAYNHFFPYSPNLKSQKDYIINKFKVVCFTETPIDQINVLLDKTIQKQFNPEPYGLVFTKDYIYQEINYDLTGESARAIVVNYDYSIVEKKLRGFKNSFLVGVCFFGLFYKSFVHIYRDLQFHCSFTTSF